MAERTRWALPAVAGAAALAVVAGVIAVVAARDPDRSSAASPAAPSAASQPAGSGTTGPAAAPAAGTVAPPGAVVHDGDRVRGEGQVVALPGRPVRLCTGLVPQVGVDGPEPVPAYCPLGITLIGADLDRLAGRQERDGAVWGHAEVTGIYRDRTVTVAGQRLRTITDVQRDKPLAPDLPADCRPPAGGWPRREVQAMPGIDQVGRYVAAHPEVLGSVSIGYPEPTRSGAIGTQVLLVGTTGDVAEATRQIRRWYAGSLCVRSVPHSRAQLLAARAVLDPAMTDSARQVRYGLVSVGETSVGGDPRVAMTVLVHDERVHGLRTSAGADLVDVEPLLRKLT
jgi:hypothetical protein